MIFFNVNFSFRIKPIKALTPEGAHIYSKNKITTHTRTPEGSYSILSKKNI